MSVMITCVRCFQKPFYYQVLDRTDVSKINRIDVNKEPFVLFKYNNSFTILSDKCPHQGASLSKGWLNPRGNIHCPYHAFEFDKHGHFCGIPESRVAVGNPSRHQYLSSYKTFRFQDDLYLCTEKNVQDEDLFLPYYPPEHFNNEFFRTHGYVIVDKNQKVVTENVLDMLHISYVHSFGNRDFPLPFDVKFRKLSNTSGRSTFRYRPFKFTISNQVGKSPVVIVENEYHLPTTTITRVTAGDVIKTVMTRATPISDDKTLFFWSVYRNFWCSKDFPIINVLGDMLMDFLMNRTIKEDVDMLKNVYPEARVGNIITKYDVTIQQYRKALDEWNSKP